MNPTTQTLPSPRSLYWRDLNFRKAVNAFGFSLVVVAGFLWMAQPVPSVVKVESSPFEIWALQWGPAIGIAVAVVALLFAVRRYFWVRSVLSQGVPIKGIVEEVDVLSYERSSSETSTAFNRPKSYSYFVVVRYPCQGAEKKTRFKLPNSPSTYKLYKDKEVDLIALESAPSKPLIREVYLGRF